MEDLNPKLLIDFRNLALKNLVKFWEDKKDIKIAVHETLSEFNSRKDMVGWIRGDNNINTAILAEEIARLSKENFDLRNQMLNTGTNALYGNLTYSELEKLLKNDYTIYDGEDVNLFEFRLKMGEELSSTYGFSPASTNEAFERLSKYKLVLDVGTTSYNYKLTDDGHNFYLKSLLSTMKE